MTAWSRLHAATLELVKSAPLKQRLASAFQNHLKGLEIQDLPPELRAEFAALAADLETVLPLPGETAVQATVRKMSAEQADRCAMRIVELAHDYVHAPASVTRFPVRDRREEGNESVPRLFAAEG
ncbi:MAG: hypothetical protein ACK53C_11015 [Pseudomonadota bacterium]